MLLAATGAIISRQFTRLQVTTHRPDEGDESQTNSSERITSDASCFVLVYAYPGIVLRLSPVSLHALQTDVAAAPV